MRTAILILLVLTQPVAIEAQRRRAVRSPGDESTPVAWLAAHATELHGVELAADRSDLESIRAMVGRSSIVALGDATHGTHEFFAVKHRIIDYLVREMDFDVLAIEAPFAITERIDAYVQGGPGDPRPILDELRGRLLYLFWDVEELLAVIEWARDYNLHRGEKPPVHITGADIYDETGAVSALLEYLKRVDPSASTTAAAAYACALEGDRGSRCETRAREVHDWIATRPNELIPIAGAGSYQDALHYATVVLQNFDGFSGVPRDRAMSANVLWIRDHRGASGRIIFWAHQEHTSQTPSSWVGGRSAGSFLEEAVGEDYFAIGTLTGSGRFHRWQHYGPDPTIFRPVVDEFPDASTGTYEWYLRQSGKPYLLVPLDGDVPDWLATASSFRSAGTTSWGVLYDSLPAKLDAVVYVDVSTPTRLLR